MAKFDKFQVMAKIAAAPMVPVFYNKDVEVCKNVIKACYEGGVRASSSLTVATSLTRCSVNFQSGLTQSALNSLSASVL